MTTETTYGTLVWGFDAQVPPGEARKLLRRRWSAASTTLVVFGMSTTLLEWRHEDHLTLIVKHHNPQESLSTLLARVDHDVTRHLRALQEMDENLRWQGQLEARVDEHYLEFFRRGAEDREWVFAGRQGI